MGDRAVCRAPDRNIAVGYHAAQITSLVANGYGAYVILLQKPRRRSDRLSESDRHYMLTHDIKHFHSKKPPVVYDKIIAAGGVFYTL